MRRFDPKIIAPPHSNLPFEVVMVESFDGEMVRYADHAAELARVEVEREQIRKAWCVLRFALNAIAWGKAWDKCDNEASPRHIAQDALAIGCPVANARAEKSAAESLEAANALLRAECEAWRAANGMHDWTGDDDGPPYHITSVRIAMSMTDAAGALKGVE